MPGRTRATLPSCFFDEEYEVIVVESRSLVIPGVLSGNVLVIDTDPEFPQKAFRPGQLITLSDPAAGTPNEAQQGDDHTVGVPPSGPDRNSGEPFIAALICNVMPITYEAF